MHDAAFLAYNLGCAANMGNLPECFLEDLSAAWTNIRSTFTIHPEILGSVDNAINARDADLLEPELGKQRWWQRFANDCLANKVREQGSLRLQVLLKLNAAHQSTDVTSLVCEKENPFTISSRAWTWSWTRLTLVFVQAVLNRWTVMGNTLSAVIRWASMSDTTS